MTADAVWTRVARQARCADSGLDPDQWYPVSTEPARARREAAAAIAVCTSCPARAQCLELSLRHWDIGRHGVWVAWSQPTARTCVAGGPPTSADAAGPPCPQ